MVGWHKFAACLKVLQFPWSVRFSGRIVILILRNWKGIKQYWRLDLLKQTRAWGCLIIGVALDLIYKSIE